MKKSTERKSTAKESEFIRSVLLNACIQLFPVRKSTTKKSTERKTTAKESVCVGRESECVNVFESALGHEREAHAKKKTEYKDSS